MGSRFRAPAAVGVLACSIIASGCGQGPTAPSQSAATWNNVDPVLMVQADHLSIEGLEARGWDCRPAPVNPAIQTCSHPNQLHPVLLPDGLPPDRPPSITLLVFINGVFTGTNLLIRSDLYHGQMCKSTEAPYRFIGRIGYYECLHQSQAG